MKPPILDTSGGVLFIKGYDPYNGLLIGSFIDSATSQVVTVYGAILQKQQIATGFFLGTGHVGAVSLAPPLK